VPASSVVMEAAQADELVGHAAVQTAVLDRQRDPVGDGAQLVGVGALEGVLGAAHERQVPERLVPDDQPRPRDVLGAVAGEEERDGDVVGGTDPDVRAGGELRQAERALRQVARPHAVVAGDGQRVVGPEAEQCDVGAEELAELDRGALHDDVELHVLAQGGDDLREAGRPQQRAGGVALGVVDAPAQLVVLAPQDVELVAHSASTETEVMWKPPGPIRRANSP
jgi:hypothetical protein